MGLSKSRVPFKSPYKRSIRVTMTRRVVRHRKFPKIRGTLFWGSCNMDPTI